MTHFLNVQLSGAYFGLSRNASFELRDALRDAQMSACNMAQQNRA